MRNYDAQSPKLFITNEKEIKSLNKVWGYSKSCFDHSLNQIRKFFGYQGLDVIDFTIREVPQRRSRWDSARLLCIKTRSEYLNCRGCDHFVNVGNCRGCNNEKFETTNIVVEFKKKLGFYRE